MTGRIREGFLEVATVVPSWQGKCPGSNETGRKGALFLNGFLQLLRIFWADPPCPALEGRAPPPIPRFMPSPWTLL